MADNTNMGQINLAEARNAADTIKAISRSLDSIFEEWRTLVMGCINDPTKYNGQTRDAYERTFSSLRTTFTNFVNQVDQKSTDVKNAANEHESRDRAQAHKADELARPQ